MSLLGGFKKRYGFLYRVHAGIKKLNSRMDRTKFPGHLLHGISQKRSDQYVLFGGGDAFT